MTSLAASTINQPPKVEHTMGAARQSSREVFRRLEGDLIRSIREHGEELAAARLIRQVGGLHEDAIFWMVSHPIITIGEALAFFHGDFGTLKRFITDSDDENAEDDPAWEAEYDRIMIETLRAYGEDEMAELLQQDREEFYERGERGRAYFHG